MSTATYDRSWRLPVRAGASRLVHPGQLGRVLGLAAGGVVAVAVAARALWRAPDGSWQLALFDDAMVSMSYARTFAGGDGLVWYPGADRVEGITNPAWTAVMALLHRVGLEASAVAGAIIAVGLATVWASALVGRRIVREFGDGSQWFDLAVVAVVAANVPLVFWSLRGMEVGLVTALALASVAVVARSAISEAPTTWAGPLLGTTVALGVCTRTDFVMVALGLAAWVLRERTFARARVLSWLAAGVLVPLVATGLARWVYYGVVVPNTYFLKADGVAVTTRIVRGTAVDLVAFGAYLAPALMLIALSWRWLNEPQRAVVRLLGAVAGAQVIYSTWVGADAWESFLIPNRYLTPAVVCLALAGVAACLAAWGQGLRASVEADPTRRAVVATVAAVIGLGPLLTIWVNDRIADRFDATAGMTARAGIALWLPAVVVASVGALVALIIRSSAAGTLVVRGAVVPVGLAALLLASNGFRLTQVLDDDGNRFSRLGSELALVTEPDAVVAAAAAGGTQYWARRPMVDLLGKNDPVISRSEPAVSYFVPGHNKFDLVHSVDVLRPDVVAQGVSAQAMLDRGYLPFELIDGRFSTDVSLDGTPVIFVRPDSSRLRWEHVRPVG